MDVEEISSFVKLADSLVYEKTQKYLNCLQKELLHGVLAGLKYKDIQGDKKNEASHYRVEYLGSYAAYELWKLLAEVFRDVGVLSLGERVGSKNVRVYLERTMKQQFSQSEATKNITNSQNLTLDSTLKKINNNSVYCINKYSSLQLGFQVIHWVGRQALIAELTEKLLKSCRVLSLVGITGIGKTTLARRLTIELAISQAFPIVKLVDFNSCLPSFDAVARCILGDEIATDEGLLQNPERLVAAVVGKLRTQPLFLIVDMVEEVLEIDRNGVHQFKESIFNRFLEQVVRSDVMASRIVITSQHKIPVIAEGRHPTRTDIFRLNGLEEVEALELFQNNTIDKENDLYGLTEASLLKRIIRVYEGHPLALRVIAGEIEEAPYQGDIQAYWHDYGGEIEAVEGLKSSSEESCREDKPKLDRYSINLTELVKTRVEKTFSRLFKSSPLACLMLCMGGKYRRAVERRAWLMLIDEYTEDESLMAFQILQRRFLLEEEYTPHKVLYRLHSLIRRVALDNLSKIENEVLPP